MAAQPEGGPARSAAEHDAMIESLAPQWAAHEAGNEVLGLQWAAYASMTRGDEAAAEAAQRRLMALRLADLV